MAQSRESVDEAVALESEAAADVQAAVSEKDRGGPAVSVALLLDALEKERDSLDLLEQGVNTFQEVLQQRRQALELQQQVLLELAESLKGKGS